MKVLQVYNDLLKDIGPQKWWPISGTFKPPKFEVCIGAILTQNTNWKNVEKALQNLVGARKTSPESIGSCSLPALEKLVKPSGFFRQKAKRLKEFSSFMISFDGDFYKSVTREELLTIKGIGRETADSILLYACNRPVFVVDAYTRRLFSRLGLIGGDEDYDKLREMFEKSLPNNADLYKEFHALIVEHEKRRRKKAWSLLSIYFTQAIFLI